MHIYHDEHADLGLLQNQLIAVIGYGNQGRAQALNLRDSGLQVIIGNRADEYAAIAEGDGFSPRPIRLAAQEADVLLLLVPDEILPPLFDSEIAPHLGEGKALVFASGFNIAFGFIAPPPRVDVALLAPRMIGAGVRDLYLSGKGFPAFIGVAQDHSGQARDLALALAKGIGSTRAGVVEVSFAQEAELDLFTEQCFGPAFGQVLVTAVDLLIEQGYPPEAVLLELYMSGEFAYTLSKIAEMGLLEQSSLHSLTSQYGSLSRGMRFILPDLRGKMLQGLQEIREGSFAREWAEEHAAGYPTLESLRAASRTMPLYQWERELRAALRSTPGYRAPSTAAQPAPPGSVSVERGAWPRLLKRLRREPAAPAPLEPLPASQAAPVLRVFLASLAQDPALGDFARERHLTVLYLLSDIDQTFYMQFEEGAVFGALGSPPAEPDVRLETQWDLLDGMFTGRVQAMRAAMSGRLKFGGDTRQAMAIQRVQDDLCRLYRRARQELSRDIRAGDI
jgi:ketol-acid reductoisomerase